MAIPVYYTIVVQLFEELDLLLNNFVFNAYNALAHYLALPLGLAMVLYIVLLGLSITNGWVKLSMSNLVKSAVKLALIYMAAMNWGWFSHYVVSLINDGAGQLGDILVKATPVSIPHFAGEGINGAIQTVLIEFTQIGSWIWNKGSWHAMGPCFSAILIWGFGYASLLVAIFELVLAKIMLAILFATAPLFVSFTLFKPTHGFFDRWLGACVGFGFLMIFVSSMLGLTLSIAQWAITGVYVSHASHMSTVGFVPVMVVGFLGIGIILKTAQLAQSIGGTISTNSGSSLLAGTVGGAMGSAMSMTKMPLSTAGMAKNAFISATALSEKRISNGSSSAMNAIRQGLRKMPLSDRGENKQ